VPGPFRELLVADGRSLPLGHPVDTLDALCSHEMVRTRRSPTPLRAVATAVLLAFIGATAAGDCCPMAAAGTPQTGNNVTPHDCCQTGLSGKVPSCCHADDARSHVAVVKSGSPMAPPTVSAAALIVSLPVEGPRVTSVRLARLSHGPPLTVLRV
jgi:hypothetical protein